MYELPPILSGSAQEQLQELRDYLVRLSMSLEAAEAAAAEPQNIPSAAAKSDTKSEKPTNSEDLKSLIVKTAATVRREIDRSESRMAESYLALSDFGSYAEQIDSRIVTTARGTVESYGFESRLDSAESLLTELSGRIRRGIITDPETGESCTGIAIGEELSFTGAVTEENGRQCWELSPGQTLGIYTATGWQFWINGSRRGWFDSRDGLLHSGSMQIEESLYLGPDWQLSSAGGFGIRRL